MSTTIHRISAGLLAVAAMLWVGCGPSYPNCDNDEDCHEGEFCVNGQCQMCRTDGDCPAGQSCVGGACEAIPGFCQSTADCPDGQECRDNRCVTAAQSQVDLPDDGTSGSGCQLGPVYFGFDADALDGRATSTIQANVSCMREREMTAVHVTGHCDPRGTEEYNLALGDRRAQSVMQYMLSLGVDRNAVSASSMGEEMATGTDEPSWSRDRRVEYTQR